MKKSILLFLLLISLNVFTQSNNKAPYPKSVIDIGVGLGPNYGLLGGNLLLGYKGSGLLLSYGNANGIQTYSVYIQISHQWAFFNFGRGATGLITENRSNRSSIMIGNSLSFGGKINLDHYKRIFLSLSLGFQDSVFSDGPILITNTGPIFGVGFGYRISFSKSDYERYRENRGALKSI